MTMCSFITFTFIQLPTLLNKNMEFTMKTDQLIQLVLMGICALSRNFRFLPSLVNYKAHTLCRQGIVLKIIPVCTSINTFFKPLYMHQSVYYFSIIFIMQLLALAFGHNHFHDITFSEIMIWTDLYKTRFSNQHFIQLSNIIISWQNKFPMLKPFVMMIDCIETRVY